MSPLKNKLKGRYPLEDLPYAISISPECTTREYFGIWREQYQKIGFFRALKFDWEVTMERVENYIFPE